MIKIPKLRWVIVALLFSSASINYIDRMTLSVVVGRVLREFSMSEQDYAHIVSLFLLAYAVMYAGSGYIVDRLGTRLGFAVFMLTWSAAQVVHGFASGKWSLAACRFLLGLAEPGAFPAGVKAVGEWFPPGQRALGVGWFNAGTVVGAALGAPLAAFLALHYGWRSAFVFTGAIGFLWLVVWMVIYQPPASNRWLRANELSRLRSQMAGLNAGPAVAAEKPKALRVLFSRQCYTLVLARFFSDPVVYFVLFWFPAYLQKARRFDLAMVGKYAWVPFLLGGTGYIFGGWLSGRLIRAQRGVLRARKTAMLVGACLMPTAILAPMAPTASLAIAAMCLVMFGHAVWIANLLTLPTDLFQPGEVGTATGFSGTGGSIGGILATLAIGYAVTHFSYRPVFLLAGLMHPLSIILIYWLLPDRYFGREDGAKLPQSTACAGAT